MSRLTEQHCEACRADAPRVTEAEREQLLPQIPEWTLTRIEGVEQLLRRFHFPDFVRAMGFANRVGELAAAQGHHPAILVEWGRVAVRWWTDKIHGLHRNDFVMAARTDQLVTSSWW